MRVTVVDYGRSNLLSVCRALAALGAQPQLAQTPEQVRRAGALEKGHFLMKSGGRPVGAAVQSGRVLGCQFHPEKSARAGLAVLQGFLRMAQQAGGATG